MTCTCGATNPEGARFCRSCGTALSRPVPSGVVEAPAPEPRRLAEPAPMVVTPAPVIGARTPGATIEGLPFVPRNSTNVLSRLEMVRDRIYDDFSAASEQLGVQAMVLKSPPFNPTVWVSWECWAPHERAGGLVERSSVVVTIRPRELHRFEHEIDVVLHKGHVEKTYRSVIEFTASSAREVVEYLLDPRTSRPLLVFKRCRSAPWELWLPANPLTGLEPEPWWGPALVIGGAALVGAFMFGWGALLLVSFFPLARRAFQEIRVRQGRVYVISTGKPVQEPRNLQRMDSWQTLIVGLGGEAEDAKERLRAALVENGQEGATLTEERIWYRGVDGKQEREQVVVTFRRAIAFVHVHPYGKDLYVGWDAHVNAGTWVEKLVDVGRDPRSRELCQVNAIQAGWHVPNEYDIADANCLIEWVHSAATRVLKRMLAEHRIDQEIDFQILRGERQGIAGRTEAPAPRPRRFPTLRREG